MIEKILTVRNRAGIHARPAALIAQTANKFASEISLEKDTTNVNAKSIMGVCSLDFDEDMALSCATMSDRDLENLVARFLKKEDCDD